METSEASGKHEYKENEAFMLCVFWILEGEKAAQEMLDALTICARETQVLTTATSTYFFRSHQLHPLEQIARSHFNEDLPLKEHPQIAKYIKQREMGLALEPLQTRMSVEGFNPNLANLSFTSTLKDAYLNGLPRHSPNIFVLSEVYLDEKAFWDHVNSKDYLKAYGRLMKPTLSLKPFTITVGNPTASVSDKVLQPILKSPLVPLLPGSSFFSSESLSNIPSTPSSSPSPSWLLEVDAVFNESDIPADAMHHISELLEKSQAVHRVGFVFSVFFNEREEEEARQQTNKAGRKFLHLQIYQQQVESFTSGEAWKEWEAAFRIFPDLSAQLFTFSQGEADPENVKAEEFLAKVFKGRNAKVVKEDQRGQYFTGYPLHPLARLLRSHQ